jgi:hypothetical protein
MIDMDFPPNQLTPEKVFNNNESVLAATANMYTLLSTLDNFVLRAGIYTDELVSSATDATTMEFANSVLTADNSGVKQVWQNLYFTIYRANAIIEGAGASPKLADSVKQQVIGEAKFMRAFCNFYLVNIFGEVPLTTSSSVEQTSTASRHPVNEIYLQIVNDLKDAQQLLPVANAGNAGKVRANKWTAAALLARIYLYQERWGEAEVQASLVINSGSYSLVNNLNSVFLASSTEAIFQYWNTNGISTLGTLFIPSSGAPLYSPSNVFLNSFETGDARKTNWLKSAIVSGTTYYYPYKYKQRTTAIGANIEYSMYLRLSEQYLIRAEARAQQNKLSEAAADLNLIRNRATLPNVTAATQSDLLTAIHNERRFEFFAESGHRFFDLKRTRTIDTVMLQAKSLWRTGSALFPIPQSEILLNPNLSQNPGYH